MLWLLHHRILARFGQIIDSRCPTLSIFISAFRSLFDLRFNRIRNVISIFTFIFICTDFCFNQFHRHGDQWSSSFFFFFFHINFLIFGTNKKKRLINTKLSFDFRSRIANLRKCEKANDVKMKCARLTFVRTFFHFFFHSKPNRLRYRFEWV